MGSSRLTSGMVTTVNFVAVAVSALAWLASLGCALVGLGWQRHLAAPGGTAPGTVLSARSISETTQDLVVGITARRGRRPDAVIQMKLRRGRLTEGQQVRVAVAPDGRVRLGLGTTGSATLSRPVLAYLGAAQLAVIGLLVLVLPV
jgi:hypothetical protein